MTKELVIPRVSELPVRVVPGFGILAYGVLGNPPSPGLLLAQVPPDRTPLHRTGYERYSPNFRELLFLKARLPVPGKPQRVAGKKRAEALLRPGLRIQRKA